MDNTAVDDKLWMYLLRELSCDITQDYLTSLVLPREWIVLLAPLRDGMSIAFAKEEKP